MSTKLKSPAKKKTLAKEVFELKELKRKINDSAEAVESLVKSVKDKSRQALTEALICGKALLRAKEILKFGQFTKWVAENCKKVSHDTVNRYMKLANSAHVRNQLETGNGLRQAYIAIGILKEDDSAPSATLPVNGKTSHHASTNSTATIKDRALRPLNGTNGHSKTPLADTLSKASGRKTVATAKPTISKDDALSRARHLVNELVIDINNKLTAGLITSADVKAELKPLAEFMR
jgi:hypothetical protein